MARIDKEEANWIKHAHTRAMEIQWLDPEMKDPLLQREEGILRALVTLLSYLPKPDHGNYIHKFNTALVIMGYERFGCICTNPAAFEREPHNFTNYILDD